ncbi:MAG: hypothetical protein KC416_12815 [Myxococcales bacterium]|nr:hypothetical protein [Myxococcales bacterium]
MDLQGAIDLHVHAAPSLFPRWGDAWDLAYRCREDGMAGVVVKFHHGSSVELAHAVSAGLAKAATVDGSGPFHVFGGVVLNHFVGGLNPYAVESCVRLGGKLVWLPTIHSVEHGAKVGPLGGFGFQQTSASREVSTGIRITDGEGTLLPEVREILDVLHGQGTVLATGHVAADEIRALLGAVAQDKREVPILVNHCFFKAPSLTVDLIREFAGEGVWFEVADLSASTLVNCTRAEIVAEAIVAVPDARWVLVSDSGQRENVPSPEALLRYGRALIEHGVSEETVRRMVVTEPRMLLGLDGNP